MPAQALSPAYLSPPVLGGDPTVGRTLTCSPGDWFRASAFAYSWRRGASAIAGQTSSTYVVRPADRGKRISCSVTAFNNIGEYTIVVPAGGAVDLRFSPEADSPLAPEFLGGTSSSKGATTIVATEADPKSGVDVVLSLGGVVVGRVTVQGTGAALLQRGNATADAATIPTDTASVSGTVTYGAGSPVAHTQVCVDGFTACTSTNAAGEYTLDGLAAGTHNINFSGEDLVDGANAIGERVAEAAGLDVTLAEGEARQGVDAQLRLGGRISGTVVGPSGQPLGNVQVCTTEPFHEGPNYFPPGPQSCSYTNSSASTSSASSNQLLVPVPSSAFALVSRARVGRALHEIDFSLATTQPGTLTWKLSFCSPPTVRHGRCVRGSIPFAAGTEKVAAGTRVIRVRSDARALRALRAGQTLHVTARVRFQSALGGAPRSREVLLTVAPARPPSASGERVPRGAHPASRKSLGPEEPGAGRLEDLDVDRLGERLAAHDGRQR
ncbi:MAG TPA: carboxypeptidase regulatory-like domain-containing protein, partial [Solirubrobacteraceae bacterium]|nr:carboxypeptidase regulatory-like domain-containing protein [Solirubrobacteraceae bacterium]